MYTKADVTEITTIVKWLGLTIIDTRLPTNTRLTAVHSTRLHVRMLMQYADVPSQWECIDEWINATAIHSHRIHMESELIDYGTLIEALG